MYFSQFGARIVIAAGVSCFVMGGQAAAKGIPPYPDCKLVSFQEIGSPSDRPDIHEGESQTSWMGADSVTATGAGIIRTVQRTGGNLYSYEWYCPKYSTEYNGVGFGAYASKAWLKLDSTEKNAAGATTNSFSDTHDPLGIGVILDYRFRPWANNIVVAPFVSFEYQNMSVNHTFANGSYLGTTSNFAGTLGVKVGPELPSGVWLYGIAGVSMLNETLKVNFIPVSSSTTTTVPGATLGLGGAIRPDFLQGFGRPVSLFAEYHHTWWQDATFNAPSASPLFNYTFRRQDDTIKFGFIVSLASPAAPPAPRGYPVKAK